MRWWQTCFMIFGIACFIVLLILFAIGAYLWNTDPFGVKPMIENFSQSKSATSTQPVDHPLLNEAQEQLLQNYGIDVNALPKEITPELKACAETQLGKERLQALKDGAKPTASDFLKAQTCIK